MPVSVASVMDPFRGQILQPKTEHKLRIPQARLLRALMPDDPSSPSIDWPMLNRAGLGVTAGYTPISGSVSRALAGIHEGNKTSGDPHPGLLPLGYVEEIVLDIEGLRETNYRITEAGVRAFQRYVAEGGKLPPLKPVTMCVNHRYKKKDQ